MFNQANVILDKDDPFKPYVQNHVISNIQDGSAFIATLKQILEQPENQGIPILVSCLKLYIDKTHTDLMGKYTGEPLLAVFTFLTLACQGQVDFQMFLGMVADMDRKSSAVKQTLETGGPCRNYHNQLHVILQALSRIQEQGGLWMKIAWNGVITNVKIIIPVLLVTGNTKSQNCMAARYASNHPNLGRLTFACDRVPKLAHWPYLACHYLNWEYIHSQSMKAMNLNPMGEYIALQDRTHKMME